MKGILLLLLTLASPAATSAGSSPEGAAPASRPNTGPLGRFLVQMAPIIDPGRPAELSLAEARSVLEAAGFAIAPDADMDAAVREGDVVRLAAALGVRLKSLDPEAPFPAGDLKALTGLLQAAVEGEDGTGFVRAVQEKAPDPELEGPPGP